MDYFKNKTVLITGASSGIGACFAKLLSKRGAFVILSSRRVEHLERIQSELAFPHKSSIFPMDMLNISEIDSVCQNLLSKYSLDIVILNAGISQRGSVLETDFEVEETIWKTNYQGLTRVAKNLLPHLIEKKAGHFVVLSSVTGKIGVPGRSTYSASKHALHGYFDSLRAEVFKHNIDVTLVCPGYIFTNISKNALKGDGQKQNRLDDSSKKGMDVEVFVQKALKGIARKKQELLIGGKEIIAVYLKRFSPRLLSRIIRNVKKP